jgi:hypothetical protein
MGLKPIVEFMTFNFAMQVSQYLHWPSLYLIAIAVSSANLCCSH